MHFAVEVQLIQLSFQLIIKKGTAYVDEFRYSKEPFKKELFKKRIEPHLHEPVSVVRIYHWII